MLLHDSSFHLSNRTVNKTAERLVTVAYSPLFHSTLTLLISIFGISFNLLCALKIRSIIRQHQERKRRKLRHHQSSNESKHILAHNRYRYLFILASNDFLLCLSAVISCIDEKYFFQAFLARHHLCAAHILAWKFTLHFIPLLIIFILCRYHFILYRKFQAKVSHISTWNQLLCSDLSILIPFVLALAWSVDGVWLWGVAHIKDFLIPLPATTGWNGFPMNQTFDRMNSVLTENSTFIKMKDGDDDDDQLYLPEQKFICYFQTNHNFNFTVRLVHLIQADFLLLFSLHLIGLILEISLQIRLCCCLLIKRVTSSLAHERQLCLYILYLFTTLTLTSLPFYTYRTIEILFDTQSNSASNESLNSRMFAQLLLLGVSFKPILFFMLYYPSSILCISNLYPHQSSPIADENRQRRSSSDYRTSVPQSLSSKKQSLSCSPPARNSYPNVRNPSSPRFNSVTQPNTTAKSVQFDTWI